MIPWRKSWRIWLSVAAFVTFSTVMLTLDVVRRNIWTISSSPGKMYFDASLDICAVFTLTNVSVIIGAISACCIWLLKRQVDYCKAWSAELQKRYSVL